MKSVSSSHYSKNYYLTDCAGFEMFKKTQGQKLDRRLKAIASKIPVKSGMRVLDVGCGRGEMVFWVTKRGCQAQGVDYSPAAISLANKAKKKLPKKFQDKCGFSKRTITQMNFAPKSFDAILLIEVMEHLYPQEQVVLFRKIKGWLKDDGFVFVHTEPNKLFNNYMYKYYSYPVGLGLIWLSNYISGHKYPGPTPPSQIRSASHQVMHINEPTYQKLKKLFVKTGFQGNIFSSGISVVKPIRSWKDILFNLVVYFYPLSNFYPLNILFGSDFYVKLSKK